MNGESELIPELQTQLETGVKRITTGGFKGELSPEILDMASEGRVGFVFQQGVGVLNGTQVDTGMRYLETSDFGGSQPGFGPCVALAIWSPETKNTLLAHVDTRTDLEKLRELFGLFSDTPIEISLIGGRTKQSEPRILQILQYLPKQYSKVRYDLFGEQLRQVVVDGQSGDVFVTYSEGRINLRPWDFDYPEHIKERVGSMSGNDDDLLIDVNTFVMDTSIDDK